MRARKILDLENYGAMPPALSQRRELAKEIRQAINRAFPNFVRKQKTAIAELPGFRFDKNDKIQLWSEKDYSFPMMVISYRDAEGLVQACQIRFICRRLTSNSVRYVWLSTPNKSGDVSCGSPYFSSYNASSLNKPIHVTEGALKAETEQVFNKDFNVLASTRVACSHEKIVAAVLQLLPIFIAFDTDYDENNHVARVLAKLNSTYFPKNLKAGVHKAPAFKF